MFDLPYTGFILFLLAILIVFLLLSRRLKKILRPFYYQTIKITVLAFTITPLLYLLAVGLFFLTVFYEPSRKFDQMSWQYNTGKRYQMSDDIINKKLLIGKDTVQVTGLLGNKKIHYYDTLRQQLRWEYDMGSGGGGLGFLFHKLQLVFENNAVVSVQHLELKD